MEGTVAGIPVWLFGVGLAVIASIVSNLGYNLQKRCHLDNDKSEEERHKELARLRGVVKEERRSRRRQKQQQQREASALLAAPSSPRSATSGSASDSSPPTQLVIDVASADGAAGAGAEEEEGGTEAEDGSLPRSPTDLAIAELEAFKVNYTKQRVWQLGFFLTILGSFFDFAALAFAAQSIVAPLGSLTLVCNTIFAPCMLGEEIRRQDIFATFAIILGSSIAVATASHQDDFIDTSDLFELFTQGRFVAYIVVVCGVIAALRYAVFWARRIKKTQGRERYLQVVKYHRFCYAAAAGVMGAQSVLFAKCTAQLLANTIAGKGIMFVHPWTYFVLLMLGLTIFFQVKWLNSGLRLFPSVVIVPTFQSFWILVSVLSGMAFFGEYKAFAAAEWKGGLFGVGILLTIAGVYMLSQRSHVAAAVPAEGADEETAALVEGAGEKGKGKGSKATARLLPSGGSSSSEDPSPTSSCASSVSATGASASAASSFSLADLLPPAPRRQTSREKRSNTLSGYFALGSEDDDEGRDLEAGGGAGPAGSRRKERKAHSKRRRDHHHPAGRPRAMSAGGPMGDSRAARRLRRRLEQQRLAAAGPPGVDTFAQSLYALFLQATTGRLPPGSGGGAVGAAAAADEFFSPPVSPHGGAAGEGSVLPRYTPPSLAAAGVAAGTNGGGGAGVGRSSSAGGTAAVAALPRQHHQQQQPLQLPGRRGSSIQ